MVLERSNAGNLACFSEEDGARAALFTHGPVLLPHRNSHICQTWSRVPPDTDR